MRDAASATQQMGEIRMYVDGFVVPVPKAKMKAYLAMAKKVGKVFKEHGAIDYSESIADDVKVGKWTSFPRSVKLKRGETVVFAWVTYKNRAHRDKVNAQAMKDNRVADIISGKAMPFDGKRLIYGGFKNVITM
jgi:uncharacterized protein YbaA (DUF1428 family)